MAELMKLQESYLIVLTGPTAVGKTELCIRLANDLKSEIISADSRQFYEELTIGSAKPTMAELAQVPHHFINTKKITETYSAGDFERDALAFCTEYFTKNNVLIATGGSGLYLQALTEGLDDMPRSDEALRAELNVYFKANGIVYLQERLREICPQKMQEIDIQNPQRLMRAIEIAESGHIQFERKPKPRPFHILKIALHRNREELYQRINQRVDQMIADGLEKESLDLWEYRNHYALKTVGYSEWYDWKEGIYANKEQVRDKIKQHTRNYAKRQITWFKRDQAYQWFEASQYQAIRDYVESLIKL